MKIKEESILFISSADPTIQAGTLAFDYVKSLQSNGYNVDFLTLYKVKDHSEIFSVIPHSRDYHTLLWFLSIPYKVLRMLFRICFKGKANNRFCFDHIFFYEDDKRPPVSNKQLDRALSKTKQYDLIITLFWQGMLSAASFDFLYEKYKAKFIIICADYSPMTGGCHFISDCKSFSLGCGNCPEFDKRKYRDHTKANVDYKKKVYEKIKPVFFMNTYANENYASISPAIKDCKKVMAHPVIDEALFCPRNKYSVRKDLEIPNNKKVIFFACQNLNDSRKGIKFVIESLNSFYKKLSPDQKEEIFIITAGKSSDDLISKIPFENKNFGFVDKNKLALLFAASDLYLSGSVIDAGPMMVNQSLSCGIPVVAFKIGTALEVVDGQGTGYCAETGNSMDFENGIEWWYNLSDSQYSEVSTKCREMAIKTTSYGACVDLLMNVWKEM